MEETGLENMTENTEKEKVLSKEAIVAALMRDILRRNRNFCQRGGLQSPGLADWGQTWHMHLQESESAICI